MESSEGEAGWLKSVLSEGQRPSPDLNDIQRCGMSHSAPAPAPLEPPPSPSPPPVTAAAAASLRGPFYGRWVTQEPCSNGAPAKCQRAVPRE